MPQLPPLHRAHKEVAQQGAGVPWCDFKEDRAHVRTARFGDGQTVQRDRFGQGHLAQKVAGKAAQGRFEFTMFVQDPGQPRMIGRRRMAQDRGK